MWLDAKHKTRKKKLDRRWAKEVVTQQSRESQPIFILKWNEKR